MAKYLIKKIETYRVDSESEAKQFIEKQEQSGEYVLTRYSTEYKERKSKGEVIDSWYRVTLTKEVNSEKEPVTEFFEEEDNINGN